MTPTPPDLLDPPALSLSTRLPYRPFIMVSDTTTTAHPPVLGLAGSQIRHTIFPRQRNQSLPRIQSTPISADPPPPPAEIKYHFAVALAIDH